MFLCIYCEYHIQYSNITLFISYFISLFIFDILCTVFIVLCVIL